MLPEIFEQSKEARIKVLDEMLKTLSKPREKVSEHAPKMVTLTIDPEKIGMVIGGGGKTIRELQDQTKTEIFIDQDGTVVVSAEIVENAKKAAQIIEQMTRGVKIGEVFDGTVKEILDFGALVEVLPGKVGLLHISEISNEYVDDVRSYVKVGDKVQVKVIGLGDEGKISLSKKALEPGSDQNNYEDRKRDRRSRGH